MIYPLSGNVANLPLRPPAMLAKQAATIDVLNGGRFELEASGGDLVSWLRLDVHGCDLMCTVVISAW
jgi:hypothetical protein